MSTLECQSRKREMVLGPFQIRLLCDTCEMVPRLTVPELGTASWEREGGKRATNPATAGYQNLKPSFLRHTFSGGL